MNNALLGGNSSIPIGRRANLLEAMSWRISLSQQYIFEKKTEDENM